MAEVKSLSSPQGGSSVPGFPPLSAIEETPEVRELEDIVLPPEALNSVASSDLPGEKPEPLVSPETPAIEEKPVSSQNETVSPDLSPAPEPVTVESPTVPRQDVRHQNKCHRNRKRG